MANSKSTIDIVIGTVCKFTGIDAAKRGLKSLSQAVGKNLTNIKSGFDLAHAAVSKFVQLLSKGMEFERLTVTFKNLTGSMELAKAHMKDLQDLGRTPPFSLEAFAGASQMMMKMTDGVLGYKQSLEMVGDIAAATGNDINAVARSVGLAYQMLRDGQPFGRAGSQMVQLGILTKAQVAHFDDLSKAGGDNMALWNELSQVLGKYKGAMADTEKTAKGMIEAIQGEATVAMTDFSSAISESAKPALEGLLGWMKRINEDGTIEEWADNTVEALGNVGQAARGAIGFFGGLWKFVKATAGTTWAFAAGADEQFRNGKWYDVVGQVKHGAAVAGEYWDSEIKGNDPDASNKTDTRSERASAKKKRRADQAAKVEAESKKRIEADMAQAQEDRAVAQMSPDEQVEHFERKIADLESRKHTIEVEVEESRQTAEDVDHKPETVAVAEAREQSESPVHLAESVEVIETRIKASPVEHPSESVAVTENREPSEVRGHASETVAVNEERTESESVKHLAESVDVIEKRIGDTASHASESVEIEESRKTAEPVSHASETVEVEESRAVDRQSDHASETVEVKELREEGESLDHLEESVDVIEHRSESAPAGHERETVEVVESRTADSLSHPDESVDVIENRIGRTVSHASEQVTVEEARQSSDNAQREETVKIDADISVYLGKLKKAKEAQRKERAENYDEFVKSGSTDTFDQWLEKQKKAKAEKLKADKTAFAEYQHKNGIDPSLTADDVDENDAAFKRWRTNHDKQIAEERAANEKLVADKFEAEKKAEESRHKTAIENINAEIAAKQAVSEVNKDTISNSQTEFDRAFAMYRSEDHGAAQIAEERDYAADYKQLQKDASRYGGKWRIDELAGMMAAGDTKGQAAKLEEWRKSSSFTPEVESMVRAAAADQTKTTAEAELRQINTNTKNLADKLDQLLQVK